MNLNTKIGLVCRQWAPQMRGIVQYDSFKNPLWWTAAMYHTYNISAVNFNVVN